MAGRRRAWSRRGAGRCSVTAGSSSSAAVVEAAARSRRSSGPEQTQDGRPSKCSSGCPPEVLHHSARTVKADVVAFKTVALSEFEDHHWNRTKRDNCSGTNWPNLKVGRHSLCVSFLMKLRILSLETPKFSRCADLGWGGAPPQSATPL